MFVMAKGNLFLGLGSGKIGDIVLYRANGVQLSRSRNRNPRNPRTPAQLFQRAITSTVGRAYQVGKSIFDHSFQGRAVPEGSARRFRSLNARLLREALAADMSAEPLTHMSALVVGPGTFSPVPNRFILSEGTLDQLFFTVSVATADSTNATVATPAAADADETIADYMSRTGLYVGDIYTMVGFTESNGDVVVFEVDAAGGDQGGLQLDGQFFFVRLEVKQPSDVTMLATEATFADVFNLVSTANVADFEVLDETLITQSPRSFSSLFSFRGEQEVASMGIVRSQENLGLRSTSYAEWARWDNRAGLNWEWALEGWQQGSPSVGDSELILEGGAYGGSSRGVAPAPATVYNVTPALPSAGPITVTRSDGAALTDSNIPQSILISTGSSQVRLDLYVGSSLEYGDGTDVLATMSRGTSDVPTGIITFSQPGFTFLSVEPE